MLTNKVEPSREEWKGKESIFTHLITPRPLKIIGGKVV